MGLIKSTLNAGSSVLKDQWLEFFTLEDMEEDVLVKRAYPRTRGGNKGNKSVISNGSRIEVPQGFAMAVIDNGRIAEFSAEPGEFVYNSGTEPSIFYGGLGKGIVDSFKKWGERITFAGDVPKDTRVYYVNLHEIVGNKFGTGTPVPFDDPKYQTIYLRYFGQYSIRVCDPIVLLENVIGVAIEDEVSASKYIGQLKSEFIASLTSSMSQLAYERNISFNRLPMFQETLGDYMNESKDSKWKINRGLEIVSVGIESIDADKESQERIKEYDKMYFGEAHGRGMMTTATADAMKMAAQNEGGNAGLFMGMGLGGMMSGAMNTGANMSMQMPENQLGATMRSYENPQNVRMDNREMQEEPQSTQKSSANNTWTCSCGEVNHGKFCGNCGQPRPVPQDNTWVCQCGTACKGNFCTNCGRQKQSE